jgi:hypothetical protein
VIINGKDLSIELDDFPRRMSTDIAHQIGFSHGVSHAIWVEAYGGPPDHEVPSWVSPESAVAAYEDGWLEGAEYFQECPDDAWEGIGSTDGVHYDQCVHWERG